MKLRFNASYMFFAAILVVFSLLIAFSSHFIEKSKAETAPMLHLINLRLAGNDSHGQIIAVFNQQPNYHMTLLDKPNRIVIDMPAVDFSAQVTPPILTGMVSDIRYGSVNQNQSRIIVTTKNPFSIASQNIVPLEGGFWQLVIDFTVDNATNFNAILQKQQQNNNPSTAQKNNAPQLFRVVIDAGHGGFDSGAKGVSGVLEKNVTLQFVRTLRSELEKNPKFAVFLTRDSDVFLRLKERVQKARAFNADLFISIHADTISSRSLRGATVYTLSDKASDSVARALAERENNADLLDGLPADEAPDITDILIDLTRRETHIFSVNFADNIVKNLSENNIRLINPPHRYAGFQVLKAPDIPSVLIEIGYLSNVKDEQLMTNYAWQAKMASVIAKTVEGFSSYKNGQFNKP